MKRRIFFNFAGLILVCVVLLAASFGLLFFRASQNHEMAAIRENAYLVANLLNANVAVNAAHVVAPNLGGSRITVIAADGATLADSHPAADLAEERGEREEVVQAFRYGAGEVIRPSDTLGVDTFYYAVRLDDGNVLRLSRTLYSLGEVFMSTLPVLVVVAIAVLLLANLVANRLTISIVKPLTEINFDNINVTDEYSYEELWPYLKNIEQQRRENAEQMIELKSRTETIEAIIANMRHGVVLLSDKRLVLAVNQSVLDIFGISSAQAVLHESIGHIYRDPDFMQAVKTCLGGERGEISFTRNDRHYNTYLSPAQSGALVFFLDVTDNYKAETQRREFTANVSHELKTPLTSISALAEMMEDGMARADDVPTFAEKISGHTKRLINLIDSIIHLSAFDEGKTPRDFAEFDVAELAKGVIANLQDLANEQDVAISLIAAPQNIKANSRLIDELLFNLIENAIKYNRTGGTVTVTISAEQGQEGNECKIAVADTGIGIPKEHHARIFERFYRIDPSRSKKTGGSGLGLSIVKHIAEHHGGRITLESAEGVGTTIVCYIGGL